MTPILSANSPDIPWVYIAMMVIYFVAWLLKKIKGDPEQEDGKNARPKRSLAEVQANRKKHLQRQAAREEVAEGSSQTLRELFESINGTNLTESFLPEAEVETETAEPVVEERFAEPPPLPKSQVSLTPAEERALAKIKSKASTPIATRRPRRPKKTLSSLRSMTRGPGLRQAVILKEILDSPRSMRPYS
ncbi:MAG: hypothetical protein L3J39_17875 [Verrucomicrobiales bacterium]|nr:hypothetical protein [Verrucomicrobiales bacterium]